MKPRADPAVGFGGPLRFPAKVLVADVLILHYTFSVRNFFLGGGHVPIASLLDPPLLHYRIIKNCFETLLLYSISNITL